MNHHLCVDFSLVSNKSYTNDQSLVCLYCQPTVPANCGLQNISSVDSRTPSKCYWHPQGVRDFPIRKQGHSKTYYITLAKFLHAFSISVICASVSNSSHYCPRGQILLRLRDGTIFVCFVSFRKLLSFSKLLSREQP